MKLHCPACQANIRAEEVSLHKGLAKCATCFEIFRFDLDGAQYAHEPNGTTTPIAPVSLPRPKAVVTQNNDQLTIDVPANPTGAVAIGSLVGGLIAIGFAVMLGFEAARAVDAPVDPTVGVSFMYPSDQLAVAAGLAATIGVLILTVGLCDAAYSFSLDIDCNGMTTQERCLIWSRTRFTPRNRLRNAQFAEAHETAGAFEPMMVEIVHDDGVQSIATSGSMEANYLVGEINYFLQAGRR